MATNAGTRTVVSEAIVPNYGVVTFDEEAIANIFSLANMVKKTGYRVTYDSCKEDAFIVHAPDPDDESMTIERKFPRRHMNVISSTLWPRTARITPCDSSKERKSLAPCIIYSVHHPSKTLNVYSVPTKSRIVL